MKYPLRRTCKKFLMNDLIKKAGNVKLQVGLAEQALEKELSENFVSQLVVALPVVEPLYILNILVHSCTLAHLFLIEHSRRPYN